MNQTAAAPGFIDWAFDGLALLFFCTALYSIWRNARAANTKGEKAGNTTVTAVLAVFCALMGNPDRFQTFKFSFTGIETSAREAINQVRVTLEQLQKLAAALAEGNLNQLAFSGSIFVGLSITEKFRIRGEIVQSLENIGMSTADILKAQRGWIIFYDGILESQIESRVKEILPDAEIQNEIKQLPKSPLEELPTPDTLRDWIKSKSFNDPKLTQLLKEYDNLWTTEAMEHSDLIPFGSHPRAPDQR